MTIQKKAKMLRLKYTDGETRSVLEIAFCNRGEDAWNRDAFTMEKVDTFLKLIPRGALSRHFSIGVFEESNDVVGE